MKPLVIVQNNLIERLTGPIAIATRERGIALHDVSSINDMSAVPLFPAGMSGATPILLYGSIGFIHNWAKSHPELSPWVFWSDAAASADTWREQLGPLYLNGDGWETTVGQVLAGETLPRHYRPMTTTKSIVGAVLTPDELRAIAVEKEIADDFRLWSSAPKAITMEVRVFIIDGKIAGHSVYRLDGAFFYDNSHPAITDALIAAGMIAQVYSPARHFVCDVGLVGDEWRLIEFNPLHSSGWYGTDVGAVLDAYMAAHQGKAI